MRGKAVIVGGGIAGLATGRALRANGWQVEILERADRLPVTGTALGMWPQAMTALDALGIGEQVRHEAVLQRGGQLLRPDGHRLASVAPREPAYLISRPALHRILHGEKLADAVKWSTAVTDPDGLPDVDLIVGADGIHSRIRVRVTGPVTPRPLGTVAFRGVVAGPTDSAGETWGHGRLFGITPQDRRTTNWFAAVREDLLTDESALDLLNRLYADWHPAVLSVLDRVDPDSIDRRVLYDLPPLPTFAAGDTVVVGDAAHAMAPNAGRGACEALIDAVALADALDSADTVAAGLMAFDAARRTPSQRIVRVSRLLNRLSTARRFRGVTHTLIGAVGRLMPGPS